MNMNNNNEQSLLNYLEGEIKCTEGGIYIMINEDFLCSISFPMSDKVSINDLQKFIAEAIINERERRKLLNQYGVVNYDLITPKKEE